MSEEAIIFGKKRHFFGGIEPSNMVKFTARMDITNERVVIEAELPNDTIVDGQTLCTVAGAVIRKHTDRYPVDEFDGDEVATVTESLTIYDENVDIDGTYYYAAFPYTTQGVYNRNEVNRASVNEPAPLIYFSARRNPEPYIEAGVILSFNIPNGVEGVIIRRRTDRYPIDENDGDRAVHVVIDATLDSDYKDDDGVIHLKNYCALDYEYDYDANIPNTTYYYTAFTYNHNMQYNRSDINNHASCVTYSGRYYFGYDLDTNNSDPETRVTYPTDVDNYVYKPVGMDYDNSTFDYGDYNGNWNMSCGSKFMPKPCMLTYDGVVAEYLDPDDYTKTTDGTASRVANYAFEGNAMMEWPKIYTKRWEDENGIYHFRCSDVKQDDTWDCWCNYDKNNNEIDHFYTSIYTCGGIGGKLRSMSGLVVPGHYPWNGGSSNTVSDSSTMTFEQMVNYAKLNGDDWYTDVLVDRLLIQDLLVMMAKTTDGQTAYGMGCTSASSYSSRQLNSGRMNTSGMFFGCREYIYGVKVFGMEHWWGNEHRYLAGCVIKNTDGGSSSNNCELAIKLTRGTHDGSSASDYNGAGDGYLFGSHIVYANSSDNGYITRMKTMPFGRIPDFELDVNLDGSSSTYECDRGNYTKTSNVAYAMTAMVGGRYDSSLEAGPFFITFLSTYNQKLSYINTGLSCKPSKVVEEVSE